MDFYEKITPSDLASEASLLLWFWWKWYCIILVLILNIYKWCCYKPKIYKKESSWMQIIILLLDCQSCMIFLNK